MQNNRLVLDDNRNKARCYLIDKITRDKARQVNSTFTKGLQRLFHNLQPIRVAGATSSFKYEADLLTRSYQRNVLLE